MFKISEIFIVLRFMDPFNIFITRKIVVSKSLIHHILTNIQAL